MRDGAQFKRWVVGISASHAPETDREVPTEVTAAIIAIVSQLIVRNLSPELVARLKERAAARGRSAEEEHRRILRAALAPGAMIGHLRAMPDVGADSDFERSDDTGRVVEL